MLNKKYDAFIAADGEYEESKIIIFSVPFDSTTSFRAGTRFAGKAIRSESFGIETYSPYQDKDMLDYSFCDCGDLEIAVGDTPRVLEQITETTEKILADNKTPLMIGGEHLVTLGALRAVCKKYPDLHIIHFDAHCDLRDELQGTYLSHATVMRRAHELVGDGKIFQFGIRSGERSEFLFAKEHTYLNKHNLDTLSEVVEKLQGKNVYFSLDLDILDPSCFPGTGTPEAGGISFAELLSGIMKVSKLNLVGLDINELSPSYDQSGSSTAMACKVLREILLAIS